MHTIHLYNRHNIGELTIFASASERTGCAFTSTPFIAISRHLKATSRIKWGSRRTPARLEIRHSQIQRVRASRCVIHRAASIFPKVLLAPRKPKRARRKVCANRGMWACARGISLARGPNAAWTRERGAWNAWRRNVHRHARTIRAAWQCTSAAWPLARTCLTPARTTCTRLDARRVRGRCDERVRCVLPTRLYATLTQFSEPSSHEYVKDGVLRLRV